MEIIELQINYWTDPLIFFPSDTLLVRREERSLEKLGLVSKTNPEVAWFFLFVCLLMKTFEELGKKGKWLHCIEAYSGSEITGANSSTLRNLWKN